MGSFNKKIELNTFKSTDLQISFYGKVVPYRFLSDAVEKLE